MLALPPGTLLQLIYLKERLSLLTPGRFVEVGPGSGEITRLLLDSGWSGLSFDIEEKTIKDLSERFAKEVSENRFVPINQDYLSTTILEKVDLVISCMVMEHLKEKEQSAFMEKSLQILKQGGVMIGLVPGSPKHWGIEDEIAGHFRRYTRVDISEQINSTGWQVRHLVGLTFPISNLLFPISNLLVKRSESQKLILTNFEKTKLSGKRNVNFKTRFNMMFILLLNPIIFYPLGILQKYFSKSERCMVLYFEAEQSAKKVA
jgi:SAM-dependent methyltransferase